MKVNRFLQSLGAALALVSACAFAQPFPGVGAGAPLGTRPSTAAAIGPMVTTPHVRAELIAHAPQGLAPGQPIWVGLVLKHKPKWHTYWKNSGDSGLPTRLQWTLPEGLQAGEIAWPTPKKIPLGNLANYGYEGEVLLPVPVVVGPSFKPGIGGQVSMGLQASWLVCEKECVPEDGEFRISLPVLGSTALHGRMFEDTFARTPQDHPGPALVRFEAGQLVLAVQGLPPVLQGKALEPFPEVAEIIETAATPRASWAGATWQASMPLAVHRSETPRVLPVVLSAAGGKSWRVLAQIKGPWPERSGGVPGLSLPSDPAATVAPSAAAGGVGWIAAMLGALLGGLLLNLMPCVFPVLAIKLLAFARHADDARGHRLAGLAYTAGVVLSFLALGAALLGLRALGESLGWGFQLQNPWVVTGLALLFGVIALNLAGVFEFGQVLPSAWSSAQARHPVADSFLTGVLAVAVASPCTAPFMGASLGAAMTLPPVQSMAIFMALGVGLALPYLVASWVPAVARALPRPGPWMDTLRRFMAFPMFATVVWLTWVLGQQSGMDGAAALLAWLVCAAWLLWSLQLKARVRLVSLLAAATVSLAAVWWLAPSVTASPVSASSAESARADAAEGEWSAWSEARVAQLMGEGRPVFVDFTAAWCVTCQYNKKSVLSDPQVVAAFEAKRVVLLRADWTRRDPAISAALASLGRSGVPVYLLQAPGRPPVVMSEILSRGEIQAALQGL